MATSKAFRDNWLAPIVFICFLLMLAGVTTYYRFLNKELKPPIILETSELLPESPVDIAAMSREDFKPLEYILCTLERDGNIYIVKSDLINDIPEIFELRLYLSKSYEKTINVNTEKSWLWKLTPNNDFEINKAAIELAPSTDDIGLYMGFRCYHGKDPSGYYRLVIEFDCSKELNCDSLCVILTGVK